MGWIYANSNGVGVVRKASGGTFCKVLFPALRLGYVVLPEDCCLGRPSKKGLILGQGGTNGQQINDAMRELELSGVRRMADAQANTISRAAEPQGDAVRCCTNALHTATNEA